MQKIKILGGKSFNITDVCVCQSVCVCVRCSWRGINVKRQGLEVFISLVGEKLFAEFAAHIDAWGYAGLPVWEGALVNNLIAFFISHAVLNKQESVINSFN